MGPLRRNPEGRGFPGDLLCRAARPWGLPRASRRFAHLIPESLRRGHAGLIQRFPNATVPAFSVHAQGGPAEAELVSHRLMLRAGLIKRLAAGIYTWMPLGLRVLRKVEAIVREEMNRAGAIELLMPVVQPAELWQESGRWGKYGPDPPRNKDRHPRDFVI